MYKGLFENISPKSGKRPHKYSGKLISFQGNKIFQEARTINEFNIFIKVGPEAASKIPETTHWFDSYLSNDYPNMEKMSHFQLMN